MWGDGCGGFCGECEDNVTCTASGLCLCVPKCTGKVCGDDLCGGVCGTCDPDQECIAGLCKPDPCGIETCAQLTGPSGCCEEILYKCAGGGQLLAENCAATEQICTWHTYLAKYLCLDPDCEPDCDDVECGADGCGAFCGNCGPGYVCTGGACEGAGWTSCNDFDGDAACYGDLLYTCTGGLSVSVYDCTLLDKECAESVDVDVPTAACK